VTCRVLGVRRQGFYEWCSGVKSPRAQENELLLKHIERIHAESRGTYGWPRVHAELTLGLGMVVNHKRVARLMREAGIRGLYRRRRRGCTVRDLHAELWVPATLSTLCDLLIFVEDAAEPVVSLDLVDLGWRAVGEWS